MFSIKGNQLKSQNQKVFGVIAQLKQLKKQKDELHLELVYRVELDPNNQGRENIVSEKDKETQLEGWVVLGWVGLALHNLTTKKSNDNLLFDLKTQEHNVELNFILQCCCKTTYCEF